MILQILKMSHLLIALPMALLWSACAEPPSAPGKQQVSSQVSPSVAKSSETAKTSISKIVFAGQKEACDCTLARVKAARSSLDGALKNGRSIPIETINIDVDEQRYAELKRLRPVMVAPGIYFFDEKGNLVEMLQGEVEEYKISELIQ